MKLIVIHNLIFGTEQQAKDFQIVAENHWEHLKGTSVMQFTRHCNVLVVNDRTFSKFDGGGMLDDRRY